MAFVLGILLIIGALYLSPAITGTSSSTTNTSSLTTQQTTTLIEATQSTTSGSSNQFVPSPETVETTNSTLGLKLTLSISSKIVPSQDSFVVSASIFNTLSTVNNLTASSNWPVQGLSTGACDFDNDTFPPEGIAIFSGNYGKNNISNASPIDFWELIECPTQSALWGVNGLISFTSFAFLPKNDSGYFGYYASGPVSRGIIPARMSTYNITIWSSNDSASFGINSLGSASPSNYTLVAGDEWGQIVLLHFQVVASNILPSVGSFVAAPSTLAECSINGNPTFCVTNYQSGAFVFNCASEAASTAGCTIYTVYTITVWNPFVNQPNETSGANCKFSVQGDPYSPHYGSCFFVNSTAFFIYDPS